MIEDLPLSALSYLLTEAYEQEEKQAKEEAERHLYPLWLVGKLAHDISRENGEYISYSAFLKNAFESGESLEKSHKPTKPQRSGEDIIKDFMPIIEADMAKING